MKVRSGLLLAAALAIVGCGDPPPSKYPTEVAVEEDASLGANDEIEVRIFYGSKEITRTYRIGSAGDIAVPHIGKVAVTGRSQAEVEQEIQTRLADGYLKNPIVSIDVKALNSKKVTVMGEVKKPGTVSYRPGMTIVDAISDAGDFTPMARKNAVTVTRRVGEKKLKYTVPVGAISRNEADNFPLRAGDVVVVPQRLF